MTESSSKHEQLRDEVEALTARVKNLEALMADKDHSKSGNSGWVTFFGAFMGILLYNYFFG